MRSRDSNLPIAAVGALLMAGLVGLFLIPNVSAAVTVTACNASTYSPWAGFSVSFTSTVSGGTPPYTYYWDFGDGGSSIQANPSHTYVTYGDFNIRLTVTDSTSSSDYCLNAVGVSTLPSVTGVSFDKTSYTQGDTVRFTIQATAGQSPNGAYMPISKYSATADMYGQVLLDTTGTSSSFSVSAPYSGTLKVEVAAYDQYNDPSGIYTAYAQVSGAGSGNNPPPSNPPSASGTDWTPVVAIVLGVAVLLVAVMFFATRGRRQPPGPRMLPARASEASVVFQCPNCKRFVSDQATECECGARFETIGKPNETPALFPAPAPPAALRFCPSCGARVASKFCENDGMETRDIRA